ncbi:MAG: formylmethanofuran dehydrogenase subunit C [Thermoproteota archaeon]|nr:MAG: formylmethanofuran dehydrogenase subunit C [Candidatus Korarchaeota archaeon]RLG55531.1 MAG: formylmethanofuran dehydrogenase subunit C [Candidatus Korarchaeota archaeon]
MGEITLKPKIEIKVPLDLSCISPDSLSSMTPDEIKKLEVQYGNKKKALGEIFDVAGEPGGSPEDTKILVEGSPRIRKLGKGMSAGTIEVKGSGGLYLGEEMSGGRIVVYGDCGPWLGAGMSGGEIEVHGNAGDAVGASYRGAGEGMKGGRIVVHGSCGYEAGEWMQGGVIIIEGDAGEFVGVHMSGGTILVKGNSGERAGAQMTKGTIAILGRIPSVLPSFTIDSIRKSVKVEGEKIPGPFYVFIGDLGEGGEGRLYISVESNPHLKEYEKYLEEI